MRQIDKNTVPANNQLNGSEFVTFDRPDGSGIRVLFVGNSITRHAPAPALGWERDCGMAASGLDADYVHLMIRKFRTVDPEAAFCICQAAEWERNIFNGRSTYALYTAAEKFRADVIILRLIENCPDVTPENRKDFIREYTAFADHFNTAGNARFLFTSGFWKSDGDECIKEVAQNRGAPFVYLGDLGEDDAMKAVGLFEHTGVASHPGDLGMKAIAERLWIALDFHR